MPDIKQLPPSVINKIAAGEVIERPASVVKELLENAVDAGARRIDVSVLKGGTELIRVADDGCGITGDQLPLAVASHATSKIATADDLFRVHSFGFRGEALASIAEVSRTLVRSRTADAECGTEIEVDGGRSGPVAPCACAPGTVVEVRDLFFNTPVRRKFLRSTQTEMGHVTEAVTRVALAHPQIHFTLNHGDKNVLDLAPVESWRERIANFFGRELAEGLIPVASDDGLVRLTGFAADPNFSRGNNRMQYLFLNGRPIRDRSLQHALSEAYRGLLLTGRHPIAFLRLEMPAEAVDVNVHPAKLEVRFQDGGRLYSQLLGTLRRKFLSTDLTARVKPVEDATASSEAAAHDRASAEQHRRELIQWAQGQTEPTGTAGSTESQQSRLALDFPRAGGDELLRHRNAESPASVDLANSDVGASHHPSRSAPVQPARAPGRSALQVHDRYLIAEDETGVVVIDQHALHERILYEQLREKVLAGKMETQRLLVPETVSLTPSEAAAALESQELLAQLGIQVEPFGGDTVLVSAYPAMLANLAPAEMLRQVVEQLLAGGKAPDRRDLLDSLLHMISCKAAIKAGDRLSPEEVAALVEHRDLCQDAHHCPHGRPTALVFTREELDRRFKRT